MNTILKMRLLFAFLLLGLTACTVIHAAPRAKEKNYLDIHTLKHAEKKNALCLDRSDPVYYVEMVEGSTEWIVILEGGAFCSSLSDCESRANSYLGSGKNEHLASRNLNETRPGAFYLSADPTTNPTFYKFNKVILHYCSGDLYTGNNTYFGLEFRGHNQVYALFDDLISEWGLSAGHSILFGGESAGGVGILANLDKVAAKMADIDISVKGLDNSGYFNGYPFIYELMAGITTEWDAIFGYTVRDLLVNLYNAVLPPECLDYFGYAQAHGCVSGQHSYRFIKTPIFTMTARFDWFYISQALSIPWVVESMSNGFNYTALHPMYYSAFGNFSTEWVLGMRDDYVNTTLTGVRCENFCSSKGLNLVYNEKCEETEGAECVDKVCQRCQGDDCPSCALEPYNSNGVFFPACALHVFTEGNSDVTVNGINSLTALSNWYTKDTIGKAPETYQLVTTIGGQGESQSQCCSKRQYPFTLTCSDKQE
eukprot:Nk52_evm10s302 gene=Nk52_evmTU10s302